jgi:hypothetical protein
LPSFINATGPPLYCSAGPHDLPKCFVGGQKHSFFAVQMKDLKNSSFFCFSCHLLLLASLWFLFLLLTLPQPICFPVEKSSQLQGLLFLWKLKHQRQEEKSYYLFFTHLLFFAGKKLAAKS